MGSFVFALDYVIMESEISLLIIQWLLSTNSLLSGFGPIFDRRSTIAAIQMSKNAVGHSKLIGGVKYVTILNIG